MYIERLSQLHVVGSITPKKRFGNIKKISFESTKSGGCGRRKKYLVESTKKPYRNGSYDIFTPKIYMVDSTKQALHNTEYLVELTKYGFT